MNHPSVFRTTRLLLAIAVSGIAFFGPVPEAEAAQQKVLILEENGNDASTWRFEPADITVPAGTTVVWEWQADDEHSATSDNGAFDSGVKRGRGTTWSFTFASAGDFPYSCTPHPFMIGTVKVT